MYIVHKVHIVFVSAQVLHTAIQCY